MIRSSITEIVELCSYSVKCVFVFEGIALTREELYLVYCGQQMAACML